MAVPFQMSTLDATRHAKQAASCTRNRFDLQAQRFPLSTPSPEVWRAIVYCVRISGTIVASHGRFADRAFLARLSWMMIGSDRPRFGR